LSIPHGLLDREASLHVCLTFLLQAKTNGQILGLRLL